MIFCEPDIAAISARLESPSVPNTSASKSAMEN